MGRAAFGARLGKGHGKEAHIQDMRFFAAFIS